MPPELAETVTEYVPAGTPAGALAPFPPQPIITRAKNRSDSSEASNTPIAFRLREWLDTGIRSTATGKTVPKRTRATRPPRGHAGGVFAATCKPVSTVSVAVVEFCPTTGVLTEQNTVIGMQVRLTGLEPFP